MAGMTLVIIFGKHEETSASICQQCAIGVSYLIVVLIGFTVEVLLLLYLTPGTIAFLSLVLTLVIGLTVLRKITERVC
jgi:hypothetical protein